MTFKLPLAIALAATFASPVLAQDVSELLNPRAMIADMGLGDILQRGATAPRVIAAPQAEIASLRLDTTVLSSPRPLLRPSTLTTTADRIVLPDAVATSQPTADVHGMLEAMDLAAVDAPAGANTLVISGVDTTVVSGTNTAVIQNGATASRPSLWQRIFGR